MLDTLAGLSVVAGWWAWMQALTALDIAEWILDGAPTES